MVCQTPRGGHGPRQDRRACLAALSVLGAASLILSPPLGGAEQGRLVIHTVDQLTGQPVAARMHLKNSRGQSVRPAGTVYWKDHFVFDGSVVLNLPLGTYHFELERGPEYKLQTGYFTLERGADDTKTINMVRYVDLAKEGWWSGDLHIHRLPEEIELHLKAEDLHCAPVITWWNNRNYWQNRSLPTMPLGRCDENRFFHLLAGEDEREGGALLYFHLPAPLPLAGAGREYPSSAAYLIQARNTPGVHVDAEKPFWWDLPLWVAVGRIDSLGIANNHQQRDGMLDNEAWGKSRDRALFPPPHGNGRWSQHIYYQLLNCGLRIPPSAGSASGVLPNPVGYNRVYVHCGQEFTWEGWWENLRRGRVFVTNGPLLRPRVHGPGTGEEGALPGHVFTATAGQTVELQIELKLSTRDPIDYLEIVRDGVVVHEVRLDQWAAAGGQLPPLRFDRSGWMLVRAVTSHPKTYRFASTGPYYVEIDYQPRISRKAAQFFLDWVEERIARVKLTDPKQREEVLAYHQQARTYWRQKVAQANAE